MDIAEEFDKSKVSSLVYYCCCYGHYERKADQEGTSQCRRKNSLAEVPKDLLDNRTSNEAYGRTTGIVQVT